MLRTRDEYQAAISRIQELSGCIEETVEEQELIRLVFDVAVWESKHIL